MGKGWRRFVTTVSVASWFFAIPPIAGAQAGAPTDEGRAAQGASPALGIEFVKIPGGEFDMGDAEGFTDEKPVHRVRISEFFLAKTEVTQAQWVAVMGSNPSYYKNCDDCPVEQVSWSEAQEFIEKTREQTGLPLRLPTEAEWEYAAGGGAQHQTWAGTGTEADVKQYAWIVSNAARKTHPVCQKQPNALGLCDMSGNVMEWVSDFYGNYLPDAVENPAGPAEGSFRVLRGGTINRDAKFARTAAREAVDPGRRFVFVGFRLAYSADRR